MVEIPWGSDTQAEGGDEGRGGRKRCGAGERAEAERGDPALSMDSSFPDTPLLHWILSPLAARASPV